MKIRKGDSGVPRCPNCGAMWNAESKRKNVCNVCGRTMQDWTELKDAPNWIARYKDVNQWGL